MAERSIDSIGELVLLIDSRECHGKNGDVSHSFVVHEYPSISTSFRSTCHNSS